MEQTTRLRINLTTREIEVEGSEAFVREYAEKFENLLHSIDQHPQKPSPTPVSTSIIPEAATETDLPSTFGEYLHMFPASITDLDRTLIAGYYTQSQSSDNSFTTAYANELLKEQGIKIANAADCVSKNKKAKKVFALQKGMFRVSQTGVDYLNGLIIKTSAG